MSGMIGRLVAAILRPPCFSIRATAAASILSGWAGILQADAYAGFGELYGARRSPRPITETACWAHGRRKFFVLADLRQMPLAIEAVRRIDEIFAVEREINGAESEQRMPCDSNGSNHWLPHWKAGCGPSAPGCRVTRRPPRP
jgi:hypothetical protein